MLDSTKFYGSVVVDPRAATLQGLVPFWPWELADLSFDGRLRVVRQLRKALRAERLRGRSCCPTYSLTRHANLLRACRLEETAMWRLLRAELTALSACDRRAA